MEALIFIRTNWWTFSSFWPRYIQLLFLTSHWKPNAVSLSCPLAMSFVIWINNITLADFHLRINELLVLLQDAHTFVNIEPLSLYPFSVRYFNGIFYLYSIFGNTWLRIWIKGKFLCWLLICGYNGGGNSLLGNMLLEALNIHLSISISYGNTTNTKKALDYMAGRA